MCSRGGGRSPDFGNEEYVVSYLLSGQGRASSLNCPVIPVSEYRSTRNKLKPFAPGAICLLPQIYGYKYHFLLLFSASFLLLPFLHFSCLLNPPSFFFMLTVWPVVKILLTTYNLAASLSFRNSYNSE